MRTISVVAPASARCARRQAELELGVGDDDPLRFGVRHAAAVDLQRQLLQACDQVGADQPAGLFLADVHVVAALGLGRGSEDRLGQPVRFAQSGRQRDAADAAGLLVFLPARARQVAARHAFDRHRIGLAHEHRPAARAGPRAGGPPRGTPARPSKSGGAGRDRPCGRTRSPTAASAPCPCRGCRSRARSRTRRCDRSRRSAGDRRSRRRRAPCRGDGVSGLRVQC